MSRHFYQEKIGSKLAQKAWLKKHVVHYWNNFFLSLSLHMYILRSFTVVFKILW